MLPAIVIKMYYFVFTIFLIVVVLLNWRKIDKLSKKVDKLDKKAFKILSRLDKENYSLWRAKEKAEKSLKRKKA